MGLKLTRMQEICAKFYLQSVMIQKQKIGTILLFLLLDRKTISLLLSLRLLSKGETRL